MADTEWDPTEAAPGDTQSSDQSKSGLRRAWDAWSSRPENNAALLQFGIAMLQPRSPGQSGIGQFANAVGEGAQASERNIAAQTEVANTEFTKDLKSREAGARETTANAYADQVRQGVGGHSGVSNSIRLQGDFRRWLAKPEDVSGLSVDPIVGAISKQFPDVKTKADLLANPAAQRAAFQLFASQIAEPDEEGTPPAASGTPSVAPSAPIRKTGTLNGQPVTLELRNGQWIRVQ